MVYPKVCVVIPTRERADTLFYTLKTCIGQDYSNLEILVCDNCSTDNTEEVAKSFSDSRIRYINSGKRLPMMDNWEYAISNVDSDFVTVIGDDDALLPNAISNLVELILKLKTEIISWLKVEYCWPSHIDYNYKNYISIPLNNKLIKVKSRQAIRHIYSFFLGYNRGPCIYNSLVSRDCIDRVIDRDGKFFQATSPDIYSSLSLASVTDNYYFSTRPFSVNGASSHSNGTSQIKPDLNSKASDMFLKEYGMATHSFSQVRGSITAAILDTLIQFETHSKVKVPRISFRHAFKRIVSELQGRPGLLSGSQLALEHLARQHGVERFVSKLLLSAGERSPFSDLSVRAPVVGEAASSGSLVLWGSDFGIEDVSKCSDFAGKVLGGYRTSKVVCEYTFPLLGLSHLYKKAERSKYYLGF